MLNLLTIRKGILHVININIITYWDFTLNLKNFSSNIYGIKKFSIHEAKNNRFFIILKTSIFYTLPFFIYLKNALENSSYLPFANIIFVLLSSTISVLLNFITYLKFTM